MTRCPEYYEKFKHSGNFCNRSEAIVKKVEEYMDYMRRHKFGDYSISNCAIEPFIRIEDIKHGRVHDIALKELRKKAKKVGAKGITRMVSIELINQANRLVSEEFRLDSIPEVRSRMGTYEHSIDNISRDVREMFFEFKKSVGAGDNNDAMRLLVDYCKGYIDEVMEMKKIYDEKGCMIETVKEK